MLHGRWSTRALGEFRPQDNDVIVILPDGTGWIYAMGKRTWSTDTFVWSFNPNGSLCITGQQREDQDSAGSASLLSFSEVFYDVEVIADRAVISFSLPLSSGHKKFGLDDPEIPDLSKPLHGEERVHELIKYLHWYTPQTVVDQAISQLVQVDDEFLCLLLQPVGKAYWDNAALALSRIDHGRLEPLIPGMLDWLWDLNWPGAECIAELLRKLGEIVVPHVKAYLQDSDGELVSWIFSEVIGDWPKSYVAEIEDELVRLTLQENASEYSRRESMRILKKYGLWQGM